MAFRKITIDNEEWEWSYGSSYVNIKRATLNKKHRVKLTELLGRDSYGLQRDQEKGNFSLTPRDIADYIRSGKIKEDI